MGVSPTLTPTSVSLPNLPTDKEYEEYVAACYQSLGCYVERTIIDRGEEEILELDIIATDYSSSGVPRETLVEAKSGGWGFPEIFKLIGWSKYLGIDHVELIVNTSKGHRQAFYEAKSKEIGVSLVHHPNDLQEITEHHSHRISQAEPRDVSAWRFSYWVERNLLRKLTASKKAATQEKCYRALTDYIHVVNSGIFFTKNVVSRAEELYSAFGKHRLISAKVGNELIGNDFSENHEQIPRRIFEETFYRPTLNAICISTYIEYRSRLALLKTAVDLCEYEKHGIAERVTDEYEVMGITLSTMDFLPESFRSGVSELRQLPYYEKYPAFWQNFLWLFGGFILEDYKEEEYQHLSSKTGIPVEHIDSAFRAFDILFPLKGGWFNASNQKSKIRLIRMFSTPFMGIGAHYRKILYGGAEGFDGLSLTGQYTKKDLITWNNLVFELLTKTYA